MPDVKYHVEAQANILSALRRAWELGNPSISIYALTCVCSLREDRKIPSFDDVMACMQPLLDEGKAKEQFFEGQLYRHFYIADYLSE